VDESRAPATQPYRPDTVVDGWSSPDFAVRAAAVRGAAHRLSGVPRQDECAVVLHHASGAVIAVVADGVSNAELSHLGATVVCRTVVDYLLRALDTGAEVDWHDLLRNAGWALVEYTAHQVTPVGEPDPARAERLLASTVVVALVRPDSALLVRVGDSGAWRLRGGRWTPVFAPLSDPSDELLPDGVSALPRVPVEVTPVMAELGPGDVLVLGTDGFAEPLGDGDGEVGTRFAGELVTPPSLPELAALLDFTAGTHDDDRAVVALWPA
jgi:serine/threonine protein phosphatase PrpC